MILSSKKQGSLIMAQFSAAEREHQAFFLLLRQALEPKEEKLIKRIEDREDEIHEDLLEFLGQAEFPSPMPRPLPPYKKAVKKLTLTMDVDGVSATQVIPYTELSAITMDTALQDIKLAMSKILYDTQVKSWED